MKIIIVTYYYYPALNAHSFRWTSIAEYWVKLGHEVDVVCGWNPGLTWGDEKRGVRIFRVGVGIIERMRAFLAKGSIPLPEKVQEPTSSESFSTNNYSFLLKFFKRIIRILHDLSWKKLYWPDASCLWFFPGKAKVLALMKNNNYDLLVSYAPHFTSHLIGLSAKKKFANVDWIADYGDPFCFIHEMQPNNFFVYEKLNMFVEGKVMKYANRITVTTEETAKKYSDLFKESSSKISVVQHLFDSIDYSKKEKYEKFDKDKINIVYVGSFHIGIREPFQFLEFINYAMKTRPDLKSKIALHFFGNITSVKKQFYQHNELIENCHIYNSISKEEVFKVLSAADFLLNIGNTTPYQRPSKLVEYLCIGKPIVNIRSIANDSSASFLCSYPLLHDVLLEGDISSEAIEKFFVFIESKNKCHLPNSLLTDILSPFGIDSISARYLSLLEEHD